MKEDSASPLLKASIFILGFVAAFGLYFSVFEYRYNYTDSKDSYSNELYSGAAGFSHDGAFECLVIDPSIGCTKTIYQAEDQIRSQRSLFASISVLSGILILSIFIWIIFKNKKKNILFLIGGIAGFIFGIIATYLYHLKLFSL